MPVEKSILIVMVVFVVFLFMGIVVLNNLYKQLKVNEAQLKKDLDELTLKLQERTTQAFLSPVSGLPNLLGSQARIDDMFDRYERGVVKKVTVVWIDLYKFKPVNDEYGHPKGDKVLMIAGKLLLHSVRHSDIVIHFSGDEFGIICADTEKVEIEAILVRANTALAEYDFTFAKEGKVNTKFCFGIAESDKYHNTFYKLRDVAEDDCMNVKKRSGESR